MSRRALPTNPVGIDWGNPITEGLLVAAVPALLRELVTGKALTPVSSPIFQETPAGRAGRSNGSSSYYGCDIPTRVLSQFTIMWLGRASGTPGLDTRSFCLASSASNNPLAMINVSAATASKMRTFWRDDAGNFPATLPDSTADAFQTGKPKMLAVRVSDMGGANTGAATVFVDGVQDVTSSAYTSTALTIDRVGVGCLYRATAGSFFAGDSVIGLFWGRALTNTEIQAVTRNPWQLLESARRKRRGFSVGAASHATSGELASDAATIEGTAAHLTLHTTSGALASEAAAIAGTAVHLTLHTSTGALASDAATIAGDAEHTEPGGATHTTTGALSSDAAAIAGTAAHLTLHTTTGALAADAATVAGTATHLTLHTTSGALQADAATMAGTAVHSGAGAVVPSKQGAGRPSRTRRARVVEIDGEDFIVNSTEEAEALLENAREQARQLAATAVKRAAAAERRPTRKVIADARRLLETPEIKAPDDLQPLAEQARADIEAIYQSALASVEIAALLARRQREEEDDEDVLMLIA